MAEKVSLVVGDRHKQPITLRKDALTFVIDSTSTIRAAIVTPGRPPDPRILIAGPVNVLESENGSNWNQSTVVAVFDAASWKLDTEYEGEVEIEVEVADTVIDQTLTWHIPGGVLRQQMIV